MKPKKPIQSLILILRGQKVILDADLAELYGVPTKRPGIEQKFSLFLSSSVIFVLFAVKNPFLNPLLLRIRLGRF